MRAVTSVFCGFCRPARSAKISGHAVRPLKQKTRNAVRHWNTITPERKLRTAAHAPLSGHYVWLPFSMAILDCTNRYLLLVTCRFSFRTKMKPIPDGSICCPELDCVQSPRRMGISPIAMVRLDVRRTSRLMSLDSANPLEKGLDPKPLSRRRAACAFKIPSCVNGGTKTVSLTNSLAQCGA